ncbi:MAG: GIY-YIG nuclease family protein [Chitinophagia bacterium]
MNKVEIRHNYLYLMYNDVTKLYKVGIADNLRERHRRLETSSGIRLLLVAYIVYDKYYGNGELDDSTNFADEQAIHSKFKKHRRIGEWFDFSLRDLAKLKMFVREELYEYEIEICKK